MPIDTIIKISGAIAAGAVVNSVASIDVPEDGLIMCVGGLIISQGGLVAQDHVILAEISFLSTNQLQINDARGSIAGIGCSYNTLGAASGCKTSEQNALCLTDGLKVHAGERIHMHTSSSIAGLSGVASFLLYLKTVGGGRRDGRRR